MSSLIMKIRVAFEEHAEPFMQTEGQAAAVQVEATGSSESLLLPQGPLNSPAQCGALQPPAALFSQLPSAGGGTSWPSARPLCPNSA